MKSALIAAVVAALVASGSTYAAVRINGHSIRPHSIPLNRLTTLPKLRLVRVIGAPVTVPERSSGFATANCPSGQAAIGGGFVAVSVMDSTSPVVGLASYPQPDLTGWGEEIRNDGALPSQIQAYAVCARGTLTK